MTTRPRLALALALAGTCASCQFLPTALRDTFSPPPTAGSRAASAVPAAGARAQASAPPAPSEAPSSCVSDSGFRMCAKGWAVFYGGSFEREAQIVVEVERSYRGPAGASVEVQDVQVYGASGKLFAEELGGSHFLGRVEDLDQSPWVVVGKAAWSGAPTYSLLVRCIYDQRIGDAVAHGLVAEQWGVFEGITASPRIRLRCGPELESSPRLLASATFSNGVPGAPGVAFFEVQASWSGRATAVRVYADSGSGTPPQDDAHLVGSTAPIAGQTTWQGSDLRSAYDGSDVYSLLVAVHFADGSTSIEHGRFEGILGGRGQAVPWRLGAPRGGEIAAAPPSDSSD